MSGLSLTLEDRLGDFHLRIPTLEVRGVTAVLGPNGAGKTTLLRLVLGARRPIAGAVSVDGQPLFDSGRNLDLPVEERRLGYLPQGATLFPHLDALDNVGFGLPGPRSARRSAARELLAGLRLSALERRFPRQLSGGEQQKLALLRTLAPRPRAVLLDEPLASLDVDAREELRAWLGTRLGAAGIPTLLVTHEAADVDALASEVLVLEAGQVLQQGPVEEIRRAPRGTFLPRLLRSPS